MTLLLFFMVSTAMAEIGTHLEFEVVGSLKPHLNWSLKSKPWFIRIQGLRLKKSDTKVERSLDLNFSEAFSWGPGRLWTARDVVIFGEGYSASEFSDLVRAQSKVSSASLWVRSVIAAPCDSVDLFRPLGLVLAAQAKDGVEQHAITCQISITEMIETEIKKWKKTAGDIIDGSFFIQISEGLQKMREILPQLYTQLILPMGELLEAVPSLAQGLICEVMKSKVTQLGIAMITGGGGMPMMISRIGTETLDLVGKIKAITRNRTVLNHARALEKSGKLDRRVAERLMELEADLPSDMKKSISGFDNGELRHKHVQKHSDEFRINSKADDAYENTARRFAKATDKDNVSIRQANGDYMKWNTRTDEVVVVAPNGVIRTYYKNTCSPAENQLLRLALSSANAGGDLCR